MSVSSTTAMLVNYLAIVTARDSKVIVIETQNVLEAVDGQNSFDPLYWRTSTLIDGKVSCEIFLMRLTD